MDEFEIFSEALTRTDFGERAAYLDEACKGNAALRGRVELLLAQHASDASILHRRPADILANLQERTIDVRLGNQPLRADQAAGDLTPYLIPSTRPEALGRLGHYDVLQILGQGGFGIVVKAFDDHLHRVVAIKILAPHLAATSPPRKRFLREARATAQVKHENVVQIYAVEEQPLPYLVMEFVEGQTLQDKLDGSGPLEPAEVVRLGCQIARGLAAAHDKGLIHRDVKPANVLIEAGVETRARLTDFGLARAADDASLTQSGLIAGTPLYMSPEQARGEELDHRSDLFSLGSVLYAMTTGRPPFRASGTLAILKRVADDTPRPIRQINAEVPEGLSAVIMRLLEKDPEKRFPRGQEVVDALANCLTHSPKMARKPIRGTVTYAAMVLVLVVGAIAGWYALPWQDRLGAKGDSQGPPSQTIEGPIPHADFVVTRDWDRGPGSLRDALAQANARKSPQTIAFAPELAGRTITLVEGWTGSKDRSALVVDTRSQVTIDGGTGVTLRLASPVKRRLLLVNQDASLTLKNLTLTGGDVVFEFDDGRIENQGGAVLVTEGTLVIDHCTLRGNQASIGGALSCELGTLTIRNSTFDSNWAVVDRPGGPTGGGGGAINFSTWSKKMYALEITGCTFSKNQGGTGGAIWTRGESGSFSLTNSTFQANRSVSSFGGAISNSLPNASFVNLTIVDNNSADLGGAVAQYATPLRLANSIVARNRGVDGKPSDLVLVNGGTLVRECRNNLIGDANSAGGLIGGVNGNRLGLIDLKLAPLADNGGPTKTMALLPGSPAIDAGDASQLPAGVTSDQRGLPRLKNGKVDIGAFQTQ